MEEKRKDGSMQLVFSKAGDNSGTLEMENKEEGEDHLPDSQDGMASKFQDRVLLSCVSWQLIERDG